MTFNLLVPALFLLFRAASQRRSGGPLLHFLHVVREDRGLSLAQLARAVDTYPDRVARYERGERPRQPQTIQRLADALSVSPEVFTASAITVHRDGRIEVASE